MRVYKTKYFHKWAKKAGSTDKQLAEAVEEIEGGLVDADLGGNVLKKRVATSSKGKKGGYRTLLAFKTTSRSVFLYGFEKNVRANISKQELSALKELAKLYLKMPELDINKALKTGQLKEIKYYG